MKHPTTKPENMSEKDINSEDYETEDPKVRWRGLSTILSIAITLVYLGLPTLAVLTQITGNPVDLSVITQPWFLSLSIGWFTVLVYTYGKGAFNSAKELIE